MNYVKQTKMKSGPLKVYGLQRITIFNRDNKYK